MQNKFINTYVLVEPHKRVKAIAGLRGISVPEAYMLLVYEGLKALGYDGGKVL